ncbi:MAG: exonuclease subunit SbcC [Leptolyngbyaceae cyanobacterium bins.59]|nr:exonuclease subunit SbcC [Leptolyngbyaceae cyanobacterium bins.59]
MIPLQLALKNFLSYREAILDFRGLHTACICGPNGAGKSSLLEAIAWVIWGESRALSEDDVIHQGAREAKVDFIFQNRQQIYRVIRSRQRGQATALEFQVGLVEEGEAWEAGEFRGAEIPAIPTRFRTVTERGMRATQQLILEHLKLDYETFVNSAYLRQGRADEFMLKRPSERKQILADLLKLDHYDHLAEQARERSRHLKAQIEFLEPRLESIQGQLDLREAIDQEQAIVATHLAALQQQQIADGERLQSLQAVQHQRQSWEQQFLWQQQQHLTLTQDCKRLHQELQLTHHQQQELATLLQQEPEITAQFQRFQQLQFQEESQAVRFQTYQTTQEQRQQLKQQQEQLLRELQDQIWQTQAQLEALQQQEQELQKVLGKLPDLEVALENLQQARTQLTHLDQLQAQVAPLLQRRQQLQAQLDRAQARLSARLEELQTSAKQLEQQQQRQPHLSQAVSEVVDRIQYLEQRKAYQQAVREKGLERRNFMERLQTQQREWETQLAKLDQKLQLLKQPDASCPLCDRPLDEHHWQLVSQKHQAEQEEILSQLWVLREQLAVSDREIQVLRQEYRALERELTQYGEMLERRGQLQEQLQVSQDGQQRLQILLAERSQLEQQIQLGEYAAELQDELHQIDRTLKTLWGNTPYDERTHALVRGEVERWRWAEIKQAEIKQAQRRLAQIEAKRPDLQAQIDHLQTQMTACTQASTSLLQQQIEALDRDLLELNYNLDHHQGIRQALREAQPWQLRHQAWEQARQQYPAVQQRIMELGQGLEERSQQLQTIVLHIKTLTDQLQQIPNQMDEIQRLEQTMQHRRRQLDEHLAHQGRLQQRQQQLIALQEQHTELKAQLQTARRQFRVYQELAQAFGRNGIQALMIENVLPQLEAETNQILARLSANQLHVQFVTQRASKTKTKTDPRSGATHKLIDTLDILIADARGTRPYETYSGGEAFRVNFAIRLALSRLLTQRSGAALQLLIVDEGFGTQDAEGCDRLIAAINAIAPDFACILTVTHMPHFKEAFQVRIEVTKTEDGSQLSLVT